MALTWLGRRPHIFNFPLPITVENAAAQNDNAVWMVRWVKTLILVWLTLLIFFQREVSLGLPDKLPSWLLPSVAGSIVLTSFYFVARSFQLAKQE